MYSLLNWKWIKRLIVELNKKSVQSQMKMLNGYCVCSILWMKSKWSSKLVSSILQSPSYITSYFCNFFFGIYDKIILQFQWKNAKFQVDEI